MHLLAKWGPWKACHGNSDTHFSFPADPTIPQTTQPQSDSPVPKGGFDPFLLVSHENTKQCGSHSTQLDSCLPDAATRPIFLFQN